VHERERSRFNSSGDGRKERSGAIQRVLNRGVCSFCQQTPLEDEHQGSVRDYLCDFCNSSDFFPRRHAVGELFRSNVSGSQLWGHYMKSSVVKRSIVVAGHKTSVSLEDAFWRGLKEIASSRGLTLSELVAVIDSGRAQGNLSSAIRLFVLDHYRTLIEPSAETITPALVTAESSGG
jgi:predicted DNA-binding ribbon-helix-helix protein